MELKIHTLFIRWDATSETEKVEMGHWLPSGKRTNSKKWVEEKYEAQTEVTLWERGRGDERNREDNVVLKKRDKKRIREIKTGNGGKKSQIN